MDCDSEANQPKSYLPASIVTEEQDHYFAILFEKNKDESITIEEEEEEEIEEERDTITAEIFTKLPAKNEIVLEIFSRLPPKTISKFKCVSKTISDLTRQPNFTAKHARNYKPISSTSSTGFFHQRKIYPDHDNFMDVELGDIEFTPVKGSEPGCLPDPSLNFLKQRNVDLIQLIDSCNGLLLCKVVKTCFVCNPLTREKVALPHSRRRSNRVSYALIADLNSHGYLEYKVVCLFRPRPKGGELQGSELLILSSETGIWEEIQGRLPELHDETVMGTKVFFNGSLFWDCFEDKILVCHLNSKKSRRCCYEVIEAPRAPLGRCLWEYKKQLVCYCHGFADEFPVWRLHTDEKNETTWKRKDGKEFENLSQDISSMNSENWVIKRKVMPVVRFKIIWYNPLLETVFLWVHESIFSYGFEDRRLERYVVGCSLRYWTNGTLRFHSRSSVVAYKYSFGAIQTGKIGGKGN